MKDSIKKLLENSITIKKVQENASDLEERKNVVEKEFNSFMEDKDVTASDINILSISDMVVEFMLKEAPDYIFYQSYSYDNTDGKVYFNDLDLKKKLIENATEEVPVIGARAELISDLVESIKEKKLFKATELVTQLFESTLRIKKDKIAYTTLSESAMKKGKNIAIKALQESNSMMMAAVKKIVDEDE